MQQTDLQTALARDLRQHPGASHHALWQALRDRRFLGLKFRRHAPLGPVIVDFLCLERRFIVEVCDIADPEREHGLAQRGFVRVMLGQHQVISDLPLCLWQLRGVLDGTVMRL